MENKTARLIIGTGAVLSVSRAAELLPMRDSEARAAIEAAGIVRRVGDKRLVAWIDVLESVLLRESANVEPAKPARAARLPRVKLD